MFCPSPSKTTFTLEEVFPGFVNVSGFISFRVFGFVGVYTERIFGFLPVYTQRQLRKHSSWNGYQAHCVVSSFDQVKMPPKKKG